jgi:hypothetical protein
MEEKSRTAKAVPLSLSMQRGPPIAENNPTTHRTHRTLGTVWYHTVQTLFDYADETVSVRASIHHA